MVSVHNIWRLILAFVAAFSLSAQGFDPEKDIGLKVTKGALVVTIPPQVHLKKNFMEIKLKKGTSGSLKVGALPATTGVDELGDGVWQGSLRIPLSGTDLPAQVPLVVTYQPCTEGDGGSCYPPTDRVLIAKASDLTSLDKVEVKPETQEPSAAAPKSEPAPSTETPKAQALAKADPKPQAPPAEPKGLLVSLLVFFMGGVFASLTPCVLPMIPITMAIIGARGASKGKGLLLGVLLTQGMAVTYTTLGVIAARSGGAFGAFAQKPAFLIPVSLIFALFALSLFGAFEIKLPDSLTMKLQTTGPRRGILGAFVMGLILGPLSAPCVGPLIGTAIIDIAAKGLVAEGAIKMFMFAQGMGVLFIIGGVAVSALPKSGDWLIRFKQFLGLLVFGYAVWNLRLLMPEWSSFALWTVVLLLATGIFGAFETAEGLLGGLRKGLALLALVLGLLLGVKAVETGLDLRLLPAGGSAAASTPSQGGVTWLEQDLEKALAQAKAEKKVVLVDIYAEWCAQCKELDHKTWPDPSVAGWIQKHAVAIRIDTDKVRKDLATTLQIRSYPTVLVLDADGKELKRVLGFQNAPEMLGHLQK